MTNAELTAASLLELLKDDSNYLENSEDFEKVQEGSWEQDYKYQYCTEVYKHKASGRFFAHYQSRSGSYHTDWYYNDPDVTEVEPMTRMVEVTSYVQVKS